jgi:hypothetical protein
MAEIAAACWPDRPTDGPAECIETMLAQDNTFAVCRPEGFAIVRHSGFDAELLSIDVLPDRQGHGIATVISCRRRCAPPHDLGAREFFLEVDTGNLPAARSTTGPGSTVGACASATTASPMEPGPMRCHGHFSAQDMDRRRQAQAEGLTLGHPHVPWQVQNPVDPIAGLCPYLDRGSATI